MYSARTRRNSTISAALGPLHDKIFEEGCWVAGRVIGLIDDGFVLQDESGRVDLKCAFLPTPGDIVEVRLEKAFSLVNQNEFEAKEMFVLAPCAADFFVRKNDPNFMKCVIDLHVRELLMRRTAIIRGIREFFWNNDFIETDTPELVRLPGMEPHLDVFKTEFVELPHEGTAGKKQPMYLITSPEYAMKKLLTAGFEKIFQITKSFRNKEHRSSTHNPEFTILEWYRAFSDYTAIMDDTENLIKYLVQKVVGQSTISFRGQTIDLSAPWKRVKVKDLFGEISKINSDELEDINLFRQAAQKRGYKVDEKTAYEDLFFLIFMNEIEPRLGVDAPTIVYEYPSQMAALSKRCEYNPRYAERFELYIAGLELANAFTELNDPEEQKYRLYAERNERLKMGKDDYEVDQSFVGALEFGLPPSGGIALGVDRLVMLLTGTADIRDVIFFPHEQL